ncbi:MAG: hypothetical protein ACOVOV_01340 [Dolichospermum sp.]
MITTSTNSKLAPSSKRNPCPICQKDHGCKISDSLILCLRGDRSFNVPGWKWVKEARNGMGGVFVPDSNETSTFDREEWQRNQAQKREAERKRKSSSLSEEQRDANAKKLLKQLGLATRHKADLIRRGLTESQIEEIGFKTVERGQRLILPISPDFPGANSKGDQLKNADGYLVPLFNEFSQIIGFQIAADDRSRAKYLWLSQDSDFRLSSGEPPLTVRLVNGDRDVRLCEGTLKPQIASYRHNKSFIGAAGGNFSASPKQLKRYLDSINPERVILCPDAGIGTNRHVRQRDLATIELVKSLGYQVLIEWWGQFEKTPNNDIDEIENLTAAQLLTPDEFRRILGVSSHRHQTKERQTRTITKEKWWEKFGLPRKVAAFADLLASKFKKANQPKQSKQPEKKEFKKEEFNISKVFDHEPIITYVPGELPTVLEWAELGYPEVRVSDGDDIEFDAEAIAKGHKHILNAKPAGSGKSYTVGQFTPTNLGLETPIDEEGKPIEKLKPRIFYLDKNYRNPSTATIEENFTPLPARHAGLFVDESRRTSLGKPYLIQTPAGKKPDIERSCRDAESFIYSNTKGRPIFGGKNSPLCETCPDYMSEGKVSCSLLLGKMATLSQESNISADLSTMPRPRATDIGIIEEALNSLNPTETITVSSSESLETIGRLATKNDKLLTTVRHILVKILAEIESFDPENKRYGAAHLEVINTLLSPVASSGEIDSPFSLLKLRIYKSKQALEDIIWDVYSDDFINAESAWGNPVWETSFEGGDASREVNKFIGYKWAAPSIDEVIAECESIIKSYKVSALDSPEERLNALKNQLLPDWVSPLLKVICGDRKHSLRLDAHKLTITSPNRRHEQTVKGFQTTFYLDATATVKDLAKAINLKPRNISQELERLNSELAIAQQFLSFASKFDPESVEQRQKTVNEIELKIDNLRLSQAQRHILRVVGEDVSYKNLKITVVSGIGKCGHQRFSKGKNGKLNLDSEFAEGNRIIKLVETMAEEHRGKFVSLFDRKAFTDSDSKTVNPVYQKLLEQRLIHQTAAHFRDSRGINRLTETEVLIRVGRAIANLGELAAQWQAMTGQIVNPTDLFGEYGAWVKRKIVSEDIQEIARLRANRRPNEQLEAISIGDYSEEDIEAIANYYTGATIETVDAYDICPEAARKGVQTERGIVEAIWASVQAGIKVTTSQVAEIVGVSRSRISQVSQTLMGGGFRRLVEVLEMLYRAINSKTNTFSELDLTEDELWAAREFLPTRLQDLCDRQTDAETVADDIANLAEHYGDRAFERILAATPLKTLLGLFESLFFEANQKIPILSLAPC